MIKKRECVNDKEQMEWGKWKKNGGEWKRMKEMKGEQRGSERNERNEGETKWNKKQK